MAIPVIYKGDDTDFGGNALSVVLDTDFDLDGCTVALSFAGCRRDFTGLTGRTATLSLAFSAVETAGMPVGTHRATVSVYDPSGRKRTASDDIRIRVTDDLREAYGGADAQEIDVTIETGFDPTRIMEGETLKTNTPNSMRQAIKKIAQALGATVSALAVMFLLHASGASVQTAPLGDLDLDQNPSVVTNVTFDGLTPGAYEAVSNAAMNAVRWSAPDTINLPWGARFSWGERNMLLSTSEGFFFMDYGAGRTSNLVLDDSPVATSNMAERIAATAAENASKLPASKGATSYDWNVNVNTYFTSGVTFESPYNYFLHGLYFSGGESYSLSEYGLGTPDGFAFWPVGVGRFALTNDIPPSVSNVVTKAYVESLGISSEEEDPNVPAWAKAATKPEYTAEEVGATTPEDVTAAIREQSLGGIWDQQLSVWWTPVMSNGKLTYQATTNVNMNAESNP